MRVAWQSPGDSQPTHKLDPPPNPLVAAKAQPPENRDPTAEPGPARNPSPPPRSPATREPRGDRRTRPRADPPRRYREPIHKQTATRPRLETLDAATVAALTEANHLDCELYRFAQANFEGQVDAGS